MHQEAVDAVLCQQGRFGDHVLVEALRVEHFLQLHLQRAVTVAVVCDHFERQLYGAALETCVNRESSSGGPQERVKEAEAKF